MKGKNVEKNISSRCFSMRLMKCPLIQAIAFWLAHLNLTYWPFFAQRNPSQSILTHKAHNLNNLKITLSFFFCFLKCNLSATLPRLKYGY